MEFLLQPNIPKCVMYSNTHQQLIQSFLSELSSLYNQNIMLSGVHELVHFIVIKIYVCECEDIIKELINEEKQKSKKSVKPNPNLENVIDTNRDILQHKNNILK